MIGAMSGYMKTGIAQRILSLANRYASMLESKISARMVEMAGDDTSHYLIYQVLGISCEEGNKIDVYQNKGRFLYKYAGSFLEEAAFICFKEKFPEARKCKINNVLGSRPKTFEIDCLVGNEAYEIKWRDATTDGDHIIKEHTRVSAIRKAGYKPIRIMFYYPNRAQAVKVQEALETLYRGVDGSYVYGDDAWKRIVEKTGIDLKAILTKIALKTKG